MKEINITHIAALSGLGLVIGSWCYSLGGRDEVSKAVRRFVTPAILTCTIMLTGWLMGNFSWWMVCLYGFICLTLIQGYSGDSGHGLIKRLGIVATSVLTGAFLCLLIGKGWILLIPHTVISGTTVMYSIKNPLRAAAEEFVIAMCNFMILMFYVFV